MRKHIKGYSGVDWADSVANKSTTVYYVLWVSNIVVWRSKKQSVHVWNSTNVKYRTVAIGVTELWLKILLEAIGSSYQTSPTIMTS